LGIIPINTEDTVLHGLIGVTGIAAGLLSPSGQHEHSGHGAVRAAGGRA
jgi:hypothetical protein